MSNEEQDYSAWARPAEGQQRPSNLGSGPPPEPFPRLEPAPPPAPAKRRTSTGERWRTAIALALFPIPVTFYAVIVGLIFGWIDPPTIVALPCNEDCIEVRQEIRAAYSDPNACKTGGKRLCFVPLGGTSYRDLDALVSYYRARYGINAQVLPGLDLDARMFANQGGEASVYDFTALIFSRYLAESTDPNVTLIGITPVEVREFGSGFGPSRFAYYDPVARLGVVTTAWMHFEVLGIKLEDEEGKYRLQKQVNVLVGALYFGLKPAVDPTSALYHGIQNPFDLDQMPRDLPVSR